MYVGWKTHEWNLLPLLMSSCRHSPSPPPVPNAQMRTLSSLTDAMTSPVGSQHTACTGSACRCEKDNDRSDEVSNKIFGPIDEDEVAQVALDAGILNVKFNTNSSIECILWFMTELDAVSYGFGRVRFGHVEGAPFVSKQ